MSQTGNLPTVPRTEVPSVISHLHSFAKKETSIMRDSYEGSGTSFAGVLMFLAVLSIVLSFIIGLLLGAGAIVL